MTIMNGESDSDETIILDTPDVTTTNTDLSATCSKQLEPMDTGLKRETTADQTSSPVTNLHAESNHHVVGCFDLNGDVAPSTGISEIEHDIVFNSKTSTTCKNGIHVESCIDPTSMTKEEYYAWQQSRRTCPYCGKICIKPSDLKRHLLVHTGERPFKCQYCGKAFKAKVSMHYHQKAHHKAKIQLSQGLRDRFSKLRNRGEKMAKKPINTSSIYTSLSSQDENMDKNDCINCVSDAEDEENRDNQVKSETINISTNDGIEEVTVIAPPVYSTSGDSNKTSSSTAAAAAAALYTSCQIGPGTSEQSDFNGWLPLPLSVAPHRFSLLPFGQLRPPLFFPKHASAHADHVRQLNEISHASNGILDTGNVLDESSEKNDELHEEFTLNKEIPVATKLMVKNKKTGESSAFFKCHLCGKNDQLFSSLAKLNLHLVTHEDVVVSYCCALCFATFPKQSTYLEHLRCSHGFDRDQNNASDKNNSDGYIDAGIDTDKTGSHEKQTVPFNSHSLLGLDDNVVKNMDDSENGIPPSDKKSKENLIDQEMLKHNSHTPWLNNIQFNRINEFSSYLYPSSSKHHETITSSREQTIDSSNLLPLTETRIPAHSSDGSQILKSGQPSGDRSLDKPNLSALYNPATSLFSDFSTSFKPCNSVMLPSPKSPLSHTSQSYPDVASQQDISTVQPKRVDGLFHCRFCAKPFFRLFCLQRHERVHTGIKTCFCMECGKGFSEKRNLRHHILRFHSGLDKQVLFHLLPSGQKKMHRQTERVQRLCSVSPFSNKPDQAEPPHDDSQDDPSWGDPSGGLIRAHEKLRVSNEDGADCEMKSDHEQNQVGESCVKAGVTDDVIIVLASATSSDCKPSLASVETKVDHCENSNNCLRETQKKGGSSRRKASQPVRIKTEVLSDNEDSFPLGNKTIAGTEYLHSGLKSEVSYSNLESFAHSSLKNEVNTNLSCDSNKSLTDEMRVPLQSVSRTRGDETRGDDLEPGEIKKDLSGSEGVSNNENDYVWNKTSLTNETSQASTSWALTNLLNKPLTFAHQQPFLTPMLMQDQMNLLLEQRNVDGIVAMVSTPQAMFAQPPWLTANNSNLSKLDSRQLSNSFGLSRTHSRLNVAYDPKKSHDACRPIILENGRSVYRCTYCPKEFPNFSDIRRHISFHEDIRPYKCQFCPYCSRTSSQLKVHTMRHQGIREYKCKLCNYEGVTQSDLNRHLRSKTHMYLEQAGYRCLKCGLGFENEISLEHHILHCNYKPAVKAVVKAAFKAVKAVR